MILSCQNIEYAYTVENILRGVSFHINKGEQTAIVGINGAGKTTLFKILTGQLKPDGGNIFINSGTTTGYLAQQSDFTSDNTMYDELHSANTKILDMKASIESMETKLHETEHPEEEF